MIYTLVCGVEKAKALKELGFNLDPIKNPYQVGDTIKVMCDIEDSYGEVWHKKGYEGIVAEIHGGGNGLMFSSGLGIHWTQVELIKRAKTV